MGMKNTQFSAMSPYLRNGAR